MSKLIELTRGLFATVDDEDFELLCRHEWYSSPCGGKMYASRSNWKKKPSTIRMHRVITNAAPGQYVDHINGNTLDNRRANLRLCTQSQNLMNKRKMSNNTSGVSGVTWDKSKGKWQVTIRANFKNHFIGRYDTIAEATKARHEAVRRLHGEFAKL
jgi:hypothetical protein